MRSSSCGTRASLAAESHCQDEDVTEAVKVRRSMSNLRSPIIWNIPTVTNEVWRRTQSPLSGIPRPDRSAKYYSWLGPLRSRQSERLVSSVVRHVKGSERDLQQRRNCAASNAGTDADSLWGRRADRQCQDRDSGIVVVGGVTTTQGEREKRSQGEGSYITRCHMTLNYGRTGRRIME
jgi:hypothetical protein